MKAVLSFGGGILSLLWLWLLVPLYLASAVGHVANPTTAAIVLASAVMGAALAAATYYCGVKVLHRHPSPMSSYFLGLSCAVVAVGAYSLLGSPYIHFPLGLYGHIVGPVFLGFAGFFGAFFSARSAG